MRRLIAKIVLGAVLVLVLLGLYFDWRFQQSAQPNWGLNFSITHAQYLGFDWKKMYRDILTDLKPQRLRVMALWEVIEPAQDKYNFADIDYILTEAEKQGVQIILTLGHKQPGWPECHHPAWYEQLSAADQEAALLTMLEQAVSHFQQYSSVAAWQIENEPFFVFGPDCQAISADTFAKEIALVRKLDPRPIVLTDSGEKGWWLPTARFGADIFGSTMYRKIYHHKRQKYVEYFVPSIWYRIKGGMLKEILGIEKVIGVELQAEPWFITDVYETPWPEQKILMNAKILERNAEYARRVGFAENYFWGVEWWYYGKEKQNDPEMWEAAKKIINE